jgi:hypothetical protein
MQEGRHGYPERSTIALSRPYLKPKLPNHWQEREKPYCSHRIFIAQMANRQKQRNKWGLLMRGLHHEERNIGVLREKKKSPAISHNASSL